MIYPGMKSLASMFHLVLVPIEWEDEEMTEVGIRYAVKNAKIKALYLMPDSRDHP